MGAHGAHGQTDGISPVELLSSRAKLLRLQTYSATVDSIHHRSKLHHLHVFLYNFHFHFPGSRCVTLQRLAPVASEALALLTATGVVEKASRPTDSWPSRAAHAVVAPDHQATVRRGRSGEAATVGAF